MIAEYIRKILTIGAVSWAFHAHVAAAQTTLVTFQLQSDGQVIAPGTGVPADAYPNLAHYFVSDYGLPGDPVATVNNIGGAYGNALSLSGGARFSYTPTNIVMTRARFDLISQSGSFLELDNTLFA